ncbi:WD repeat-containing protein 97 [Morone saxatilis]|uniref:WD repeat-containing protein 97 n=1 Tax=Morone saxatilis TaxID=34816 RepID=UPI0015E1F532|nr:WD repeat-containing protein 97 [Morone saxatilis]
MVSPDEETRTATVVDPGPPLKLLSQQSGTSNGRKQDLFKQDVKKATGEVKDSKSKQHVFAHGLHRFQHLPCDSPVRFMMYSEAAAALITLHADNTVCLYKADGHKQTPTAHLPFMGLTVTKISGHLVGWGPGPVFTLLSSELDPLDAAHDALDIRVCQAAEHSTELVTAGVGNVCVWSVMLMRCKVRIQEGLQRSTFTQMALAPPRSDRPHRAFAVCRQVVTVVDLDAGKVLQHKRDLCSRDITAMVYCSQLDCLIIASEELSITVWGPDWELRVTFVGHNGVVNSLFYCPALSMLLSASADCTIRCWNMEKGRVIECVHTEPEDPPLFIGGNRKGDTFFSFSHQGVDFWTIRTLYTLHCKLKGDEIAPLRQILVSPFRAPYPTRILCVSGDSDIVLVAAETGAVLTSFKAKQRVLCADYCLHKEILLALTKKGTVLQANTLTNPITLMQEWKKRGQGPWRYRDNVTEDDVQNLPVPGPACCLVLYSYVAETQRALEEWRSLQDRRGCSYRNKAALDDAKNKFLTILGHSGGCVSVLKMDDGTVFYRTPAHNGQRVTAVQVYPENGYLLSTGEDMTVVVWRVNPFVQECLSKMLSLHCGQPLVYLAALDRQLALTFQDPTSGTFNLMHFNLLNQSQTGYSPVEGHLDHFTGLCVCPDLEVFVSSSLDGTVCIWNEDNHLIGTLQLNAVPECLVYGGFGGELFLGIKGDLYRMDCAKFLPHIYQQLLLYTYCAEPVPDSPIIENKECGKKTNASTDKDEKEGLPAITSNLLSTEDTWRQKEHDRLVASNMDLAALLQGSVKCKKGKPPSTKETKKEAFDRYMKIIYGLPFNIKIDFDETSDKDHFEFDPEPCAINRYVAPAVKEQVKPESKLIIPVNVEKKEEEKAPAPKPRPLIKVKPLPVAEPKKPIIVEKKEEPPPEIMPPVEPPKPKIPPPPPPRRPRTPPPLPQREPSPEVPTFLKQFADQGWFKDLFPDKKCIPSTLSPEDFSLQLMGCLNTCSAPSKIKILAALQSLHIQGLLENTDQLYQGLSDLVSKFVRYPMSPVERSVLVEMLHQLMRLKSPGSDFVKKLLTLLACKKLGLRATVLHILTALGVSEAEPWLWPELESWQTELQDQSDVWKSLHDRADCWLELWTSRYKEHSRYLYLKSTAKWKPLTFSVVDVLNYFCSIQKEEHRKKCVAPAGRKNTVLLPLYDCSSQPILRLGETYSMARTSRPPGLILPPLRSRPFLVHFPSFISLPLPRVTLLPFHIFSDGDWVKASPRRYFIQQQSYVEYYR